MTPIFKTHRDEENTIHIHGISQDYDLYQSENLHISSYDRYKYSQCYTLNVITYQSEDDETLFDSSIKCHETSLDVADFQLDKDGIYNIYHIIIPSIEWFNELVKDNINFLKEYNIIYITDGDYVYKCSIDDNNDIHYSKCSIEEVYQVNSCGTTLFSSTETIFSTYNLYMCYINICKELLGDPHKCSACNYQSTNMDLRYRRDLVWMALNVIEYYIKRDELEAAYQVIVDLMGCGGLCENTIKREHSCGCSK